MPHHQLCVEVCYGRSRLQPALEAGCEAPTHCSHHHWRPLAEQPWRREGVSWPLPVLELGRGPEVRRDGEKQMCLVQLSELTQFNTLIVACWFCKLGNQFCKGYLCQLFSIIPGKLESCHLQALLTSLTACAAFKETLNNISESRPWPEIASEAFAMATDA